MVVTPPRFFWSPLRVQAPPAINADPPRFLGPPSGVSPEIVRGTGVVFAPLKSDGKNHVLFFDAGKWGSIFGDGDTSEKPLVKIRAWDC